VRKKAFAEGRVLWEKEGFGLKGEMGCRGNWKAGWLGNGRLEIWRGELV